MSGAIAQTKGFIGTRSAAASEPQSVPQAIATTAELTDTGDMATLTMTLSAPVTSSAFVLSEPDRVIIELPAVAFQLDPQTGKALKPRRHGGPGTPGHLIESFRFGSFAPGRSRVVIDLGGPARVIRTDVLKTPDKDGFQLLIQLAKTDRAAFLAAAQAARDHIATAAYDEPSPKNDPAASTALPRIVIDAGHGGVDSGAMVGGLIEKYVVLDFAKTLAAKLTATGHYTVVMTRGDDTFISLGDRVKIARDRDAALFISVHADTLSEPDVTGATVYTVSGKASDSEAARVAEQENQSDAAAGVDGKEETNGVSDILFDLTRRETRAYSHVFAHTLANYWKVAARLNKNPERSAGFKVLTAPDVPSVLLELGYLSNEKDASALNSAEWRDKATSQVAASIDAFFAIRSPNAVESAVENAGETAGEPPLLLKPTTSDADATSATRVSEAKPLRSR
jgi:N-acetylmuramoyl-L-alanine amidase